MRNSAARRSICALDIFRLHFRRFCGLHGLAVTSGVRGDVLLVYQARLLVQGSASGVGRSASTSITGGIADGV